MYKVILTQRALKDLRYIDHEIQNRIARKIRQFSVEPLKYARKLVDAKIGTYRFRIGDYRVVFDIDDDQIVILRVGHRKSIYR